MIDRREAGRVVGEFDLLPDPRVLPMLGEISLEQWRCVAELIDNSVDGFLRAERQGRPTREPYVSVSLPRDDSDSASLLIQDNGPGMDPDNLESAVRAGWTANDPLSYLGMFGMGFNIATARLGTITEVTTTREGDHQTHGLVLDFDVLRRQRHFKTQHLTFEKQDVSSHGTDVLVSRLKPEQRRWFSRISNRQKVVRELGVSYASMLRPHGEPITFRLNVNGTDVKGRFHCVWGGPESQRRSVTYRGNPVNAYQRFDTRLEDRRFCSRCWEWVPSEQDSCPVCRQTDEIHVRHRRVHGWVGVQRFLDNTEYGIDFLRNGRKIEIGNKELFYWNDGRHAEKEYPIDDPRDRGRIVGEVHLDHARVMYTKDRFDRTDVAWEEAVQVIRGEGPLRPNVAEDHGFGQNSSPLFTLYQAFRRTQPHRARTSGGWETVLTVPENERAKEMATHFYAGEVEYQSDEKWFDLVRAADEEALRAQPGSSAEPATITGFGSIGSEPTEGHEPDAPPVPPVRVAMPQLSREYIDDSTQRRWDVEARRVTGNDPELPGEKAWSLKALPSGSYEFFVDVEHPVFQSITFTPLDALLSELSWMAMDFQRGSATGVAYSEVLAGLRKKYAAVNNLDPVSLAGQANVTLNAVAGSLAHRSDEAEFHLLFEELSPQYRESTFHSMARRGVPKPHNWVREGRFLEYAPRRALLEFFRKHPELFFDGRYWSEAFTDVDYGSPAANEAARTEIVRYYSGLISDVIWLAEQAEANPAPATRARLLRAAAALELLEPTSDADQD